MTTKIIENFYIIFRVKRFIKYVERYVLLIVIIFINNQVHSQCNAIGGSTGTVQDTTLTSSINFTVTISPTCSFVNLGSFSSVCGIVFPGIVAPWSGNTNGYTSTITYSFSSSLTSCDLLIGYTGVNSLIVPETFLFTTNSLSPTLVVNAGTCIPWTIIGNQTTSPLIVGGLNSIHTISSSTPFNSFTISTNSSGIGLGANGGSSFALCNGSLITSREIEIKLSDVVEIKLPNVFTPNNDGINDNFIPTLYKGVSNGTLRIFNRWGQELLYTDNLLQGWNGYYKGDICSDGTYYWIVQYTTITNELQELKGFLTLIK